MGLSNKILPHYTYNDWIHWEGRWELIEGFPIAMSPAPIPRHQIIGAEMRYELMDSLKKIKCKKCKSPDPIDFVIAEDTILQPDLLIVCGVIKKKFLDFPPVLVGEILSPSTALRDRNTKFTLYQQQGVKYYLIVDSEKKTIEIYELINSQYELRANANDFTFELEEGCTIVPELNNVWESI